MSTYPPPTNTLLEKLQNWLRQVGSALQASRVLKIKMSTFREDSDREQFRALKYPFSIKAHNYWPSLSLGKI